MTEVIKGLAAAAAFAATLGSAWFYLQPGKIIPGDKEANRALQAIRTADLKHDPEGPADLMHAWVDYAWSPDPNQPKAHNPIVTQVALFGLVTQVEPVGAAAIKPRVIEPDGFSDEFNTLRDVWTLAGPPGSATVEQGALHLDAIGPSSGWNVTQLWQEFAEGDLFKLELAFRSDPPVGTAQGISFNVGSLSHWLRIEFERDGAGLSVQALTNTGGGTFWRRTATSASGLRIDRSPTGWTVATKRGGTWDEVGTFTSNVTVSSVGLYAAAKAGVAIDATVDYVRQTGP